MSYSLAVSSSVSCRAKHIRFSEDGQGNQQWGSSFVTALDGSDLETVLNTVPIIPAHYSDRNMEPCHSQAEAAVQEGVDALIHLQMSHAAVTIKLEITI